MAVQVIERGATTLGAPNAGDDIYIKGGNATITGNVDWSGVTNAAIVEVNREFTGEFAAAGAPFKARVTTRLVYEAQSGNMYFSSDGSAAEDSALVQVIGGGTFHAVTAGTITRLEVSSGRCNIAPAVVVTNLRVMGGSTYMADSASTDPTLAENHGGHLLIERGATTLTHNRGDTVIKQIVTSVFTTVNVNGPGLKIVASGTITTLNAMSGIPDVSELDQPLTITNTNINMTLRGAREFLLHPKITFTNPATKFGHDGRLPAA